MPVKREYVDSSVRMTLRVPSRALYKLEKFPDRVGNPALGAPAWYTSGVPSESARLRTTKVKQSIVLSKKVKVWFWDTVREYTGEAVALTHSDLTALLKMGGTGMATVIPSKAVMDGLMKHLAGRMVEFKVSGMSLEVNLKGMIAEVQKDFENPKRLLVIAKLQSTSERNQMILTSYGSESACVSRLSVEGLFSEAGLTVLKNVGYNRGLETHCHGRTAAL